MVIISFVVIVSLAVIVNVIGYVLEKNYKRKMVAKAKQKEFNVFNENT